MVKLLRRLFRWIVPGEGTCPFCGKLGHHPECLWDTGIGAEPPKPSGSTKITRIVWGDIDKTFDPPVGVWEALTLAHLDKNK